MLRSGIALAYSSTAVRSGDSHERWRPTMDNDQESEHQIGREILRYLEKYPDAKDTLEGIAQWWLLKSLAAKKVMEVERAVAFLLAEGLIVETRREG